MIVNIVEALNQIKREDLLNDDELAELTGISSMGIRKILSGRTKRVRYSTIKTIAKGTNRTYRVEGDKIYFEKIKEITDKEIIEQLEKLTKDERKFFHYMTKEYTDIEDSEIKGIFMEIASVIQTGNPDILEVMKMVIKTYREGDKKMAMMIALAGVINDENGGKNESGNMVSGNGGKKNSGRKKARKGKNKTAEGTA